jgi:hypothetical protein
MISILAATIASCSNDDTTILQHPALLIQIQRLRHRSSCRKSGFYLTIGSGTTFKVTQRNTYVADIKSMHQKP